MNNTVRGVVYFSVGQSLLFLVGLLGSVVLARKLSPEDFGVYAVVNLLVLKLNALAGFCVNAKLIHDAEPPSLTSQRSVFALHCATSLAAYATVFVVAPWLALAFNLGAGGASFFRMIGLVILAQPLSTIPSAALNRTLSYGKLSMIQIAEGLTFQIVSVVCAVAGFGYWSFGIASLASAGSRSLLINILSPWRIGLAWNRDYLLQSVRFGGAIQLAHFTQVPRDNIITFLGGPLFGPAVVGLLSWSMRLAETFGQIYVQVCAFVSFSSLSRIKSNAVLFATCLSTMLRYANLATLFTVSVATGLAPEIIHFVFGDKWMPAIPLFYLFAIRMVASNYTTLFDLAIKASGAPERSLKILSIWTVLEWGVALIAVLAWGYSGIAIASAIVIWFAVAWLTHDVSRRFPVDMWHVTATPIWCGAVTFVCLYVGKADYIKDVITLGIAIVAAVPVYVLAGLLAEGRGFWKEIRTGLSNLGVSFKTRIPATVTVEE